MRVAPLIAIGPLVAIASLLCTPTLALAQDAIKVHAAGSLKAALTESAGAGVKTSPDTLLDTILDPQMKLGISTPKADPAGDYAWQLFANAEKVRPGAQKALEAKALQLTGGPNSPPPPTDRTAYGMIVAKGEADVFLTYCTNAMLARQEEPKLQVVTIPVNLNVGADYGLVVMKDAKPAANRFADFLISPEGQKIFSGFGFSPAR
jgi:ABC-type molybdate transport system substrate-binding protein